MQPYLGAFGHLVALRDGDLAYLHVHPEGAEPETGQLSGPTVEFATEVPTPGRYLLYFDFQVDDEVHTASFVVSTEGATTGGMQDAPRRRARTTRRPTTATRTTATSGRRSPTDCSEGSTPCRHPKS